MEYGRVIIRSWDDASYDDNRLFELCNEPTLLARLLEQKTHSRDEQILLGCSYLRYQYLVYLENKGKLISLETDEVLNRLHLKREYASSLKQLHDAYTPSLKRAADKPVEEDLNKRQKARKEIATEQSNHTATNSNSANRIRFLAAPNTVTMASAAASTSQPGNQPKQ